MYVCMHICTYVGMYVYMYAHAFVCMHTVLLRWNFTLAKSTQASASQDKSFQLREFTRELVSVCFFSSNSAIFEGSIEYLP